MDGPIKADDPARLIDLSREASLQLGQLEVRPATREIVRPGAAALVLEPRIMQVLVALARRCGEVVSRDELVTACWGGRAVGEDAINRCIHAIRKLASSHGGFSLTTIARVGYRLDVVVSDAERAATRIASQVVLAVLPFENRSDDPEMAYFSDGVSEEIQETVARTTRLKVIGRGTSFQFRGRDKAAAHVGAAVGATHVLDGSVRRGGSKVRIAAELVECARGVALWSDHFDRDLSDILSLQDEIAGAVAAALNTAFAPSAPAGRIDPATYDGFLQAQAQFNRSFGDSAGTLAVIPLLEQVVAAAPEFARAWARLAFVRAWVLRGFQAARPATVHRTDVIEAAETALRLDPACGTAYAALAFLAPWGHYRDREALNDEALAIAPNDPEILIRITEFSLQVGRIRDALKYATLARDLDPSSAVPTFYCAFTLSFADRYEESRDIWPDLMARWPDVEFIRRAALAAAAANADWVRFEAIVDSLRAREDLSHAVAGIVDYCRALRAPRPDYVGRLLARARQELAATGWVKLNLLTSLHSLGAGEEVFELVDQSSFAHMFDPDGPAPVAGTNAGLIFDLSSNRAMMRDVRFVGLCAKLGLADYWTKTRRWPDCVEAVAPHYDFKAECRRLASAS